MKKFIIVLMNYKKAYAAMRDLGVIFTVVQTNKRKSAYAYSKIGQAVVDYLYPSVED